MNVNAFPYRHLEYTYRVYTTLNLFFDSQPVRRTRWILRAQFTCLLLINRLNSVYFGKERPPFESTVYETEQYIRLSLSLDVIGRSCGSYYKVVLVHSASLARAGRYRRSSSRVCCGELCCGNSLSHRSCFSGNKHSIL